MAGRTIRRRGRPRVEPLAPQDRAALEAISRLLSEAQAVFRPGVPARIVQAFAVVAAEGTARLDDVMETVDVFPDTAHRDLMRLGAEDRTGAPGFGLIAPVPRWAGDRDPSYTLTLKGLGAAQRLSDALERR